MSKIRLMFLIAALAVGVICVVLLLNFTAPNPTGRRYSSRIVLTRGAPQTIGNDAEKVLSEDLQIPSNNVVGQRQCICKTASESGCRVCILVLPTIANTSNRRPDFITDKLFVESKNVAALTSDVLSELSDYAQAAILLERQLWVFVRVDTDIDPRYFPLIESTGGKIIYYFSTPDYVDPVDRVATIGLVSTVSGIGVLGFWEWRARKRRCFVRVTPTPKPKKPQSPKDPWGKVQRKADDMQSFKDRVSERARRKSDEADAREDL